MPQCNMSRGVWRVAYRLVLLSILFCFLDHSVNLILAEAALVILDGDLLRLACTITRALASELHLLLMAHCAATVVPSQQHQMH